ncbi:MAG TPA: TIM barrel protein [Solirubrobacteraceae bacterium]|jgi:hydroxypyruvate isomerase|nr:TIM barrel protein [Solirubrobacteraceae bacterium]
MRWSAHISWLFRERPYLERVGAARAAGFHTIESAWPEHERERAGLARAVVEQRSAARAQGKDFEVALLNCPAGDTASGERGFVNDQSRRAEAECGFGEAVELAVAIGASNLNLLVGRALPGVEESRQRAAIVDALRSFAPIAGERGLRILLEPVNAIENPGFLAPTPAAAIELIEAAGPEHSEQLGLLLDLYHVARAGDDPAAAIERHRDWIGHVQISDHPGRGAPGSGELPIWDLLERLSEGGYAGAVGLEYEPRVSTEESLGFMRDERARTLFG